MTTKRQGGFMWFPALAGLYVACASGCADDSTLGPTAAPETVLPALDRMLPVDQETPIRLTTMPDADCAVGPVGQPAAALKVFADGNGVVQVHARLDGQVGGPSVVNLRCVDAKDGRVTSQLLRLHPATVPSEPDDAAAAILASADPASIRRALVGDPMAYSKEELRAQGFPPRPDPAAAPAQFQRWMRSASRPFVRVTGRTPARPDIVSSGPSVAATANGFDWAGFSVRKTTYEAVQGSWNVPYVSGDTSALNTSALSVEWVGLDGMGTNDLIQAGSGQDAVRVNGAMITSYFAWVEYVPLGIQNAPASFAVRPGDTIYAEVWVGEANQTINPNGGFGWFYLENDTTGQYYYTSLARPAGAPAFTGTTAEWIMERPLNQGVFRELARFSLTTMSAAYAQTTGGVWVGFESQNPLNIRMVGCQRNVPDLPPCTAYTSNLLAGVSDAGNQIMQFTWYHFQ